MFNILECRRFIAPCSKTPSNRVICNHELDFYIKADRTINIDGRASKIIDNSICFRRPGQVVSSIGDYDCYIMTLDFSKTTPPENYIRNTADKKEPPCKNILIDNLPDVFVPEHANDIQRLYSTLSNLANINSGKLIAKEILFLLNADISHKLFSQNKPSETVADKIAIYINKNFRENITLEKLAELVYLDKSYLVRLFSKQYSVTPIEYAIELRLKHALHLLCDSDMTIKEIATECGYRSASFFTTQFKSRFNKTPSDYR